MREIIRQGLIEMGLDKRVSPIAPEHLTRYGLMLPGKERRHEPDGVLFQEHQPVAGEMLRRDGADPFVKAHLDESLADDLTHGRSPGAPAADRESPSAGPPRRRGEGARRPGPRPLPPPPRRSC